MRGDRMAGERVGRIVVDDLGPSVGDLIRKLANEIPQDAAILSYGRPPLTYAALAREIACVREILNGWGIGRGDRVALVARSRAEALVATLCIADCATVVPLGSDATSSEIKSALALLKPRALIATEDAKAGVEAAQDLGISIIELHTVRSRAAGSFELRSDLVRDLARCPGPARGTDIGMIVMTSGTTSKPKAISFSHVLIRQRGATDVAAFQLTSSDRCFNHRPTHLAGSLNSALVASLLAGGAVVVPSEFDPDTFYRDLNEFSFTWYAGAPVHHEAILARAPYHREILARSSLRFVRAASYRLPGDLMRRIEQTFGVTCLERYGGTEAGLITRNPRAPGIRKAGTVGIPFNCEVAIRGADGRHLETGEEGEIVVRGPNVFSGYENDAQLSASVFVDGWYKTGDLGRFDEDNYLTICGRVREVINRGGQKISPEEVEAVIRAHPGVRDCICFPIPHRTLGEAVGAAVVVRNGFDVQGPAIRDYVRDRLSRFKVPDRIVTCDQIPRSSLGKPQRTTAAAVLGILNERTQEIPLAHGLVAELASVWRETLGLSTVGEHDNFFLLGGDSLQAIRLVVNIEARFGVRLPITIVFDEGATVAGIAKVIETLRCQTPASPAIDGTWGLPGTIPRRNLGQACPLTYSQEQVWLLSRLDSTGHLYNLAGAMRIRGPIEIGILRKAVNALVARHEILRASFPTVNGVPQQVFASSLFLDMPISDFRSRPAAEREEELIRLANTEASKPYDLENGPLLRCRLALLSDDESALLLPKHHLISDGTSNGIFYRELVTLYVELANGRPPNLPVLPVQYGDFAVWQRSRQRGPSFERLLDYWRATLGNVRSVIELPFDRPRPAVTSYRGSKVWVSFPGELVDRLRAIGAAHGVSLYTTMLAAFSMFIYRITAQDDFVIGIPIDGRIPGQTDNLLGFFVDTLPLRVQVTGDIKYTNLLSAVSKGVMGALQHHEVPFARLVQELKLPRDRGLAPLIQVMFGLLPKDSRALPPDAARFERINVDLDNARFDFLMMLEEEAEGLHGLVEYSSDLFDKETIVRLVEIYRTILAEIALDPDRTVSRFPLFSREEQKSLIGACRGMRRTYPADATIHELFAEIEKQRPDAVALINGETRLTYRALNVWSDYLAQRLGAEGVGRETVVGILSHRCPELIVGLLAVLKAGGVYLPLDPSLPEQRLRLMLEEAKAPLCLVPPGQWPSEGMVGIRTIPIEQESTSIAGVPRDPNHLKVAPDDLAYIVFTSGSTGRPKGVCVPHRGVVRLVRGTDYIEFGPNEAFLQFAPVTFDAATFEIWGCLLNGGTLVQPTEAMPSLSELARVIEDCGITTLWLGAGLFHQLVDYKLDCFRNVRQVIAGGDVLSIKHVKRFIETFPDCRLVNGYGPTENTTFTCTCTLTPDILEPSVPIGRPIANTHVYILDEKQMPVPVGIAGELYAGGDGLARGYLNQPELTAERFLADPFDSNLGAKMYRTGDRARFLANGMIQFIGRADNQVKIRGFRVEPGEIEAALREHAKVKNSAVLSTTDVVTGTSLVAYIEPKRANDLPAVEELRRYLEERLPNYMIPAKIVMVESLPLTKNGKVDREWLQKQNQLGVKPAHPSSLPRTPIEKVLGAIWCEVLGLETVGIGDNFFDLGGHSLIATQLSHRVWQELGEELPLRVIFEKPTIESLALVLVEQMLVGERGDVPSGVLQ